MGNLWKTWLICQIHSKSGTENFIMYFFHELTLTFIAVAAKFVWVFTQLTGKSFETILMSQGTKYRIIAN